MRRKKSYRGRSFEAHMKDLERRNPEFARLRGKALTEMPISTQLAVARRKAGLTQEELARRMKVSQPAVAQMEREDGNPTVQTVERIARLLGYRLRLEPT